MIWDRGRNDEQPERRIAQRDPFAALLENAPVMALLLDEEGRVVTANRAARELFEIELDQLPASLVEVTLEASLLDVLSGTENEAEAHLVHHRRAVLVRLEPSLRAGETLMFLTDVTELRRLATVRQEFVANLVHELKTPITSLRLTAESLLSDPSPKDRHRFAERLVKEADLLSKIIDNLRHLGDIETGVISLDITRFDLAELIDDSLTRRALDREIHIDVQRDLVIASDRAKLSQALGNLLDNAAKFSPPGTPIDLTVSANGEIVISVRDRGPGISPEHWSRVFERFYKIDRARPREAGGFGLGLAITKHLVQALGGRIWTEAARDGGQIFSIALPHQVLTNS